MSKKLEEMSNEELFSLFPIILEEHNPAWSRLYQKEKVALLLAVGGDNVVAIRHIGSTSVPGLVAKPTIDILLEIKADTDLERLREAICGTGYVFSHQPEKPPPHMMYMKGYTPQGFAGQAFHLHVRYQGDWDEPYFRDYLCLHPDTAQEYGQLKQRLQKELGHDRDAYTQAKTAFIKEVTRLARKEPVR